MTEGLSKQVEGGLIHDTLRDARLEHGSELPRGFKELFRQNWIRDGLDPVEFDEAWERFCADAAENPDSLYMGDELDACGATAEVVHG